MPLGPSRPVRGRRASRVGPLLAVSVGLACSAPNGSDLFQPFRAGGTGGSVSSAGSAGSGAGGSGAVAGAGQGGSTPSIGVAGTSSVAGARSEDAGVVIETDPEDAGSAADAAADPVTCVAPSAEVCDGLDNDCDDQIDPGTTCPDECTGFVLAGRGYMFCTSGVERAVALSSCEAEELKLAWIETEEENEGLVASITALDLAIEGELLSQIGASDQADEDEWMWGEGDAVLTGFQFWEGNASEGDGGEPVDDAYQSWAEGEPNDDQDGEDCGVLSVNGSANREPGQWDDRDCADELPFLCEAR